MRPFSAELLLEAPQSEASRLIDFESVEVVPGVVNGTYFVIVAGTKPYLNMQVSLIPMIYIDKPDYWKIEVVGVLPGWGLPALGPYSEHLDLSGVIGHKGIEVVGATKSEKIDIPQSSTNIGFWSAKLDNSGTKPHIEVLGRFPANEKPVFELIEDDSPWINPTELVLELTFGNLVDPDASGEGTARYYKPVGDRQIKTVLVRDPDGRTLANIDVLE